jgi:hypothetical protein
MNHHLITAALLAALCAPVWAINKCTGPDGRVVYQDAPCAGKGEVLDVKPAAGRGAANIDAPAVKTMTEAQRIDAQVAASQRERRRREIETLFLPQAVTVLDTHRRACEQDQKDLAAGQYKFRQNLYGKTHAAQVASEMAAASARCETRDRELKEQLEALRSECAALGGCK